MIMDKKEFEINDKKGIIYKIPGFRTNKFIKKIIASVYYGFVMLGCISSISISDFATGIGMLIMFPTGCYIFDVIVNKDKRNTNNIIKTIVLPTIVFVVIMNISISDNLDISAEEKAIEELGISYSEYNKTMLKHEELMIELDDVEEANQAELDNYNEKTKELELINNEFEEYKGRISQQKADELETLKKENEDYMSKRNSLKNRVEELEGKIK